MTNPRPGELDVGVAVLSLMTVDQVADLLNYSTQTVRRLIRAGRIEAVKDGALLRIVPESILAYKQRLREAAGLPVCVTCAGSPPEGFICSACGRTGSVAS